MTSTTTFQRHQREERFQAQMERIAWTYVAPWTQPHAARNRRPLTDEQERANGQDWERTLVAWPANRRVDPALAIAGDEAMIFSRGAVRAGVITKVGRTNFEVMYVTPSGLAGRLQRGWGVPVTRVSVKKTAVHAIRKGSR